MLRGSACALDGSQTPLRGAGAQPAMGCAYLGVLACSEGGGVGARVSGCSCCILGCREWKRCAILRYTAVTSRFGGRI